MVTYMWHMLKDNCCTAGRGQGVSSEQIYWIFPRKKKIALSKVQLDQDQDQGQ